VQKILDFFNPKPYLRTCPISHVPVVALRQCDTAA
jgi:hypothetical protein